MNLIMVVNNINKKPNRLWPSEKEGAKLSLERIFNGIIVVAYMR